MRISSTLTDAAILRELGTRLARARLERNITQRELAAKAGVERKSVQRVEAGEPVTTTSLVRVIRALGLMDALDGVLPAPAPSPVEPLELRGKPRRRATGARRRRGRPANERAGNAIQSPLALRSLRESEDA